MTFYRMMKIDPVDGGPLVGTKRSMLGVRPTDPTNTIAGRKFDVPAATDDDPVSPGQFDGMSVNLDPQRFKKETNTPVWSIDDTVLSQFGLGIEPDPIDRHHAVVAPLRVMTLKEFQEALRLTRDFWNRV